MDTRRTGSLTRLSSRPHLTGRVRGCGHTVLPKLGLFVSWLSVSSREKEETHTDPRVGVETVGLGVRLIQESPHRGRKERLFGRTFKPPEVKEELL